MNPGLPTVRIILVEAIIWWAKGRLHAAPGPVLQMFTADEQTRLYDLIDGEVRAGCGQTYIEWVMEHLAHHGDEYMTPDGQIIYASRPLNSPQVPTSLLEVARSMYARANPIG